MDPAHNPPDPPDPSANPSSTSASGHSHTNTHPPSPRDIERPNWPFWIALGSIALPGIIALIGTDEAGSVAALILSPLGSLVAGVLLGVRLGKQPLQQILLSIVLIPICLVASESLASAGCSLGGFRMNFQ